jgi:hypothetical protein
MSILKIIRKDNANGGRKFFLRLASTLSLHDFDVSPLFHLVLAGHVIHPLCNLRQGIHKLCSQQYVCPRPLFTYMLHHLANLSAQILLVDLQLLEVYSERFSSIPGRDWKLRSRCPKKYPCHKVTDFHPRRSWSPRGSVHP